MDRLLNVVAIAKQQTDVRIAAHLDRCPFTANHWTAILSSQHHLRKGLAGKIFAAAGHRTFFRASELRNFLLRIGESLEVDERIAADDLLHHGSHLRPLSLETELAICHLGRVGSACPFVLLGALYVFFSLSSDSCLRAAISGSFVHWSNASRNLDRLVVGDARILSEFLEQLGISLPDRMHMNDLADGATMARIFSLRMLDHDLGWDHGDLQLPAAYPPALAEVEGD